MLSEKEKEEAFEQVKVEMRSILLSSKHGVALKDVQNDYEMLSCKRLPFRDLGFKDVASLMQSLPDVARETRSVNGEITYHAVSDESTAHIQKLVSNQTTKKKKPSRGSGRGRGRGGLGRGGLNRGRGGIGTRGGRGGFSKGISGKPRILTQRGRPGRGRPYVRYVSAAGGFDEQSGSGDIRNFGGKSGFSTVYAPASSNITDNSSMWDESETLGYSEWDESDIVTHSEESKTNGNSPMLNLKIGVSKNGARTISEFGSPLNDEKNAQSRDADHTAKDLREVLNEKRSRNLSRSDKDFNDFESRGVKGRQFSSGIGRGKKIDHTYIHSVLTNVLLENAKKSRQQAAANESKILFQKNLPPRFQRKQQEEAQPKPAPAPQIETPSKYQEEKDVNNSSPVFCTIEKKNWVPPENGELFLQTYYRHFRDQGQQPPEIEIIPGRVNKEKGFYGRLKHNGVYYYPLEILHTEEQARQNAARSFCQTNKIPLLPKGPPAVPSLQNTQPSHNPPWLNKQLLSLIKASVGDANPNPQPQPPAHQSPQPSPPSQYNTTVPSRQNITAPLSPLQPSPASQNITAPLSPPAVPQPTPTVEEDPLLQAQKDKIYKLMKSNGIWLKQLPNMYKETYGEQLKVDLVQMASQWTDYFIVEELDSDHSLIKMLFEPELCHAKKKAEQATSHCTPGRYIVYPVPDAMAKRERNNNNSAAMSTPITPTQTATPVPPNTFTTATPAIAQTKPVQGGTQIPLCQLPPVGSQLGVMFSFVYSGDDVYFQRQDTEKLIYEMEEALYQDCPTLPPPDVNQITVGSLVGAYYEEGWYRAEVKAVTGESVTVYFIDYGNTEKVVPSDIRPVPKNDLTLKTPPLALKCAFRKSEPGEWFKDVSNILTKISESYPVLSCAILEHRGDRCLVDVFIPGGPLVNSNLIQESSQPGVTSPSILQPHSQTQNQPSPMVTPTSGRLPVQRTFSGSSSTPSGVKLFADDPEPLMIPESNEFAVYVCRVMSERSALIRVVDDNYSDKLDELEQEIGEKFYQWALPRKIRHSNMYAAMVLASAEDAEDEEYDEDGKVKFSDCNRYYRVRVLRELKNGTCECYLPDHGHHETINVNQLREIDPQVNASLPYQAIMVTLHGLDALEDRWRPMAVKILIKMLMNNNFQPFYAVKTGQSAERKPSDGSFQVDPTLLARVRKIISCLNDEPEPAKVAKIYHNVYGEHLEQAEEVIKHIPGYGLWKERLEIDLYDTSSEDTDLNVNEEVLKLIERMKAGEAEGKTVQDVFVDYFGSCSTSQADTESMSLQEGAETAMSSQTGPTQQGQAVSGERLNQALSQLSVNDNASDEDRLSRVQHYINDLSKTDSAKASAATAAPKSLYTWNTNPAVAAANIAVASHTPTSTPPSSVISSEDETLPLPGHWNYPLLKSISLHIISVDSPSNFVAVPMEQRGALEKMEVAIAIYASSPDAKRQTDDNFSNNQLYAAVSEGKYHRALFVSKVAHLVKMFFPDSHTFDTVEPTDLFILPQQFYSLPFLAYRMRLGGVSPTSSCWDPDAIDWFKANTYNKSLYGIVTSTAGGTSSSITSAENSSLKIPQMLVVRLIDTNSEEDVVVDEYLINIGLAFPEK